MFFFFAVWAGPGPPPKQQKQKHAPAQTAKKNTPEKPKQQKIPDSKKKHSYRSIRYNYERYRAPASAGGAQSTQIGHDM